MRSKASGKRIPKLGPLVRFANSARLLATELRAMTLEIWMQERQQVSNLTKARFRSVVLPGRLLD